MITATDTAGRTVTAPTLVGAARALWPDAVRVEGMEAYSANRLGNQLLGKFSSWSGTEESSAEIVAELERHARMIERGKADGWDAGDMYLLSCQRSKVAREAIRFGLPQGKIAEHSGITLSGVSQLKRRMKRWEAEQ